MKFLTWLGGDAAHHRLVTSLLVALTGERGSFLTVTLLTSHIYDLLWIVYDLNDNDGFVSDFSFNWTR